jgi:hypothetical protein
MKTKLSLNKVTVANLDHFSMIHLKAGGTILSAIDNQPGPVDNTSEMTCFDGCASFEIECITKPTEAGKACAADDATGI